VLLLLSHDGLFPLLPALPSACIVGSVRVLRGGGAVRVYLACKDGVLERATLVADRDTAVRLRWNGLVRERALTAGERTLVTPADF
jgi:hypothetical protein